MATLVDNSQYIIEPELNYIEWGVSSHFSFLEASSSPSELIQTSIQHGLRGIGLADRMGLYGCVEALRALETIKTKASSKHSGNSTNNDRDFFYAPGIRLHFDHADPLLVYPLHKAAHSWLCRFLSDWALGGLAENKQEKGLPPLRWRDFRNFLNSHETHLQESFLFFSAPGRFFPWPDKASEEYREKPTQDRLRVAPSFSIPPQEHGQFPLYLRELSDLCGKGEDSALSLIWPMTLSPGIQQLQKWLLKQSLQLNIPLVASSLPLMSQAEDFELAQLLCSLRHNTPLKELGLLGNVNTQRRILKREELPWHKHIFEQLRKSASTQASASSPPCPFQHSIALKERHAFSLKELHYSYPIEKIPAGMSSASHLRQLTFQGAQKRYSENIPHKVIAQLNHELDLIEQLDFEDYFLTIYEILQYAREEKILFQGRGSAANSAVCYCLGITAIDPVKMDLLFERFLSLERHEPPDIDIDFEHERREEVLQEIYKRYGRHRAAMVANTIRFRGRMAMRSAGKALGLNKEELEEISNYMGREGIRIFTESLDPKEKRRQTNDNNEILKKHLHHFQPKIRRLLPTLLRMAQKLVGLPRHLGIHSCGFVLAHEDLRNECILEPARKENRSVIPWNKDDVDFLGWVKVDFLSLGMLTAIRKCFEIIGKHNSTGEKLTLASVPQDCPKTYAAIRRADTVGVFQIESRAQMNMLPQLAPKNFYDLVIQVAIVRPGPLQGGMVHPFIRRRQGRERPTYAHPRLKKVLGKTLGVPIFQEQVMRMAVEVADFTAGEAEQMRKVMSQSWRSHSQMHKLRTKLIKGMLKNGIKRDYADSIYKQIEAFGEYGFPESHSASFAILAYISSWLKTHYPAAFLCSLLDSQPMGFYAPRALIGDAKRHGVEVLSPHIAFSRKDSLIEAHISETSLKQGPVRLGLGLIKGLKSKDCEKIEALQASRYFQRNPELKLRDLRAELPLQALQALTQAGALAPLAVKDSPHSPHTNVQEQIWQLRAVAKEDPQAPSLFHKVKSEANYLQKLEWNDWQKILNDYQHLGFSLQEHPAHYARLHFFPFERNWKRAEEVWRTENKRSVNVLGLLSIKQKPPTAKGMCFLTLEDESGFINIAIEPKLYSRIRTVIDSAPLLAIKGELQKSSSLDPNDPHTSTVSVWAQEIWDPFRKNFTSESDLQE